MNSARQRFRISSARRKARAARQCRARCRPRRCYALAVSRRPCAKVKPRYRPVHQEAEHVSKEPFGEMPKGPLQIVVSIDQQKLHLYSDGVHVADTRLRPGCRQLPTPLGVFSIIQKDRYHHSNIYSNAPMPFMQRITWSGVALHEGENIGHPASHGCIRMPHDFAVRLWVTHRARRARDRREAGIETGRFRRSASVRSQGPARPAAAPEAIKTAQTIDSGKATDAVAAPKADAPAAAPMLDAAADAAAAPTPAEPIQPPRLTPKPHRNDRHGYCRAAPSVAAVRSNSARRRRRPRPTTGDCRRDTRCADSGEAQAPRQMRTSPRKPRPSLRPRRPPAPEAHSCRQRQCAGCRRGDRMRPPCSADACRRCDRSAGSGDQRSGSPRWHRRRQRSRLAPMASLPAADEVSDPAAQACPKLVEAEAAAQGPIAVFISRKASKDLCAPAFRADVRCAGDHRPIRSSRSARMCSRRWNTERRLDFPLERGVAARRAAGRNAEREERSCGTITSRLREGDREGREARRHLPPPQTPAEALARIDIPQDVVERISEMMVPGSSLIVSDHGLGDETGDGTDFIVVTH